jgi:hypothetical protein
MILYGRLRPAGREWSDGMTQSDHGGRSDGVTWSDHERRSDGMYPDMIPYFAFEATIVKSNSATSPTPLPE